MSIFPAGAKKPRWDQASQRGLIDRWSAPPRVEPEVGVISSDLAIQAERFEANPIAVTHFTINSFVRGKIVAGSRPHRHPMSG